MSYPSLEELDTMITTLHDINTNQADVLVPVAIQKSLPVEQKFEKSFVQPSVARKIHAETMEKARQVLSQFNIDYNCTTLPPLFVRCNSSTDLSLPLVILAQGELLLDASQVPDLILHFFSKTGSILVSLCRIDPQKMTDYWITERTLFAMEAPNPLTLDQFQRLYDITRYAVLRNPV